MGEQSGLRGVVAVGASAGGVEALMCLAAGLPRDLPYSMLVVLHVPPGAPSVLASIIDRHGPLPASTASDGVALEPGRIYVAAPDHHLIVVNESIVLSRGPTENGHRPAINALFRSVALAFGNRAVGVLLSGVLDDGVLGLSAIRSRGGITICQQPEDALFAAMPTNARRAGVVDHCLPARDIGKLLEKLSAEQPEARALERDSWMELENRIAMAPRFAANFESDRLGPPSGYTCPDCTGSLQSIGPDSYRCHVGHAWTADALLHARDAEIESAMWVAVRSLQEKAKLALTLAANVGPGPMRRRYVSSAEESERALSVLVRRLTSDDPKGGDSPV